MDYSWLPAEVETYQNSFLGSQRVRSRDQKIQLRRTLGPGTPASLSVSLKQWTGFGALRRALTGTPPEVLHRVSSEGTSVSWRDQASKEISLIKQHN